jgi:hypothetical protein
MTVRFQLVIDYAGPEPLARFRAAAMVECGAALTWPPRAD